MVQDAIEIRRHLHDRNLMEYGDVLEGCGKTLRELLAMSDAELANETNMKRGHIARYHMNSRAWDRNSPFQNTRFFIMFHTSNIFNRLMICSS